MAANQNIYGSGAHELFVAVVSLSITPEQVAGVDWAAALHRDRPDLVQRVRSLWTDWNNIARPGAELFVLAALGGCLHDIDPGRFLADLPALVERALTAPRAERPFPWFPDLADMIRPRLEALRDPVRMADYCDLLEQIWACLEPEWHAKGLPLLEAEATLFRDQVAQGKAVLELLPRGHLVRLDWCLPVFREFLSRQRVVVLPSYFGQGGHAWDLDGWFYVGYSTRSAGLSKREAERAALLARRMKAFSDPTRLTILAYLSQLPVSVSDLAAILGVSQPTASEHLRLLRDAGLVTSRRDGNRLLYRTDGEAVRALLALVGQLTVR